MRIIDEGNSLPSMFSLSTASCGLLCLALAISAAGAGEGDSLSRSAQRAAAHLVTDQKPEGYWLTTFTPSTNYEHPQLEMNVFVTSMLVDLLEPVEVKAGLEQSLTRARAHLGRQIEANGLVRYHGRPESPTIPSLGCMITPDSDDTALVWSLVGDSKSRLLPGVLGLLQSYRTSAGLYRTWLAPRAQYQNLDPGGDPNPADIGIQMDVLVFLAKFDPEAAAALGTVLQGAVGDEQDWVYYRLAPLLPLLREAELRRLGYSLRLPRDLARSSVRGQSDWIMACQLLAPYLATGKPARFPHKKISDFLSELAADDFAVVRREPPLFYHNDLTAHVRRFYWSEDFGYALWLRLYLETMTSETAPAGRAN